jgi:hypothetical protein
MIVYLEELEDKQWGVTDRHRHGGQATTTDHGKKDTCTKTIQYALQCPHAIVTETIQEYSVTSTMIMMVCCH